MPPSRGRHQGRLTASAQPLLVYTHSPPSIYRFGVLPLTFANASDYDRLQPGDTIRIADVAAALKAGREIAAVIDGSEEPIMLWHQLSERQIDILLAGGAINLQATHH